jgi:hypothetical protein
MQTERYKGIKLMTDTLCRPSREVNVASLLQIDGLAPHQYQQAMRRTSRRDPEQELMLAVLKDAIYCFLRYASARDKIRTRLFLEAKKWLMNDVSDWPFSFANICGVFGLSPQYLRAGLLRRQEVKLAKVSKGKLYQLTAAAPRKQRAKQNRISGGLQLKRWATHAECKS